MALALATLDSLTSSIVTLDHTGRIVMTNEPWRRFVSEHDGDPRPLVDGANYLEACDAICDPALDLPLTPTVATAIRAVQSGLMREYVHEYSYRSSGGHRWLRVRVTPLFEAGHGWVVVTHTDVTERRLADVARAQAQQLAEATFRFAPDALVMTTAAGLITQVNQEAARLFGYEAGELQGASIEMLVPHDLRAVHRRHRGAFVASAVPQCIGGNGRRLRAVRKDGSEFFVEIALGSYETPDGLAVVAAVRDVTARCAVEDQLLHAQRHEVVGQLAGAIAHDFNNLVQVIGTSAECALSQLAAGSPSRRDVEMIRTAGVRASSLIRRLLAFSGRQAQSEALDLSAVVTSLEPLLARLMGPTIRVAVHIEGSLRPVRADSTQVEQLLLNLAANARDAMPAGGRLSIDLSMLPADTGAGERVKLVVSDTGAGMDAGTRARIFEPFFTTKAPGKGTGLGLATVHGIVDHCGGEIECDSQPGRGTTFTIHLPAIEPTPLLAGDSDGAGVTTTEPDESGGGTETILVIEDEEFLRMTVRRILEQRGYRVLVAGSGDEALRLVEAHEGPLDLVVSDILMPGMSGWEAVERIRERRDVRALFTSGYPDEMGLEAGGRVRETRFIAKPFSGVTLARKVRELLSEPDEALAG